jgi:nucleoside-diphosphate-sugar epimerase
VKRVLLTGRHGFIGQATLPILIEWGFEVHAIASTEFRQARSDVIDHRLDLLHDDPSELLSEIAPTHLLHLAWYAEPGRFWDAPENLDWVGASLRLARAFARAGGKRFVGAGSCAEYDWSEPCLDERETPLRPGTLYGEAKASTFRVLEKGASALGVSFAWGRVFFPFGPHEKPGRLLSTVFDKIQLGEEVELSSGKQQREFIHVEDVGRAFVRLLDSDLVGPFNIARGEAIAVRDLVERAARIAGGEHLLRFGTRPLQPGEPAVMSARTDRLRNELGFVPNFTVDAGLEDMFRRRSRDGCDKGRS